MSIPFGTHENLCSILFHFLFDYQWTPSCCCLRSVHSEWSLRTPRYQRCLLHPDANFHVIHTSLSLRTVATGHMWSHLEETIELYNHIEYCIQFKNTFINILIILPGHNQSPVGILAIISTRPYLKPNVLTVCTRGLRIGGAMSSVVQRCEHQSSQGVVQLICKI